MKALLPDFVPDLAQRKKQTTGESTGNHPPSHETTMTTSKASVEQTCLSRKNLEEPMKHGCACPKAVRQPKDAVLCGLFCLCRQLGPPQDLPGSQLANPRATLTTPKNRRQLMNLLADAGSERLLAEAEPGNDVQAVLDRKPRQMDPGLKLRPSFPPGPKCHDVIGHAWGFHSRNRNCGFE